MLHETNLKEECRQRGKHKERVRAKSHIPGERAREKKETVQVAHARRERERKRDPAERIRVSAALER